MSQLISPSVAVRRRGPLRVAKATGSARIVQAANERLVVTYSVRDDVVYVFSPPGEDPAAVLRAACLVLTDDTYEDLAVHLGVSGDWATE